MYANTQIHYFLSFQQEERAENYLFLIIISYYFSKISETKNVTKSKACATHHAPSQRQWYCKTWVSYSRWDAWCICPSSRLFLSSPTLWHSDKYCYKEVRHLRATPYHSASAKKGLIARPLHQRAGRHVFFSLDVPRSYTEVPPGHMVIIAKFWKAYNFEAVKPKYILIDPLDNKWTTPEVFNKWRKVVERGDLHDLDLNNISSDLWDMEGNTSWHPPFRKLRIKMKFFLFMSRTTHWLTKMRTKRRIPISSQMKN